MLSRLAVNRIASLTSNVVRSPTRHVFARQSATLSLEIAEMTKVRRKTVGWWLIFCSGMAYGTVVIGGVTRLTESGLSMVNWHLFKETPPVNGDAWEKEFARYKQFPEFKLYNTDISLEEFRRIWMMEWTHRQAGRIVGGVFLLPACYFWYKGFFVKSMKIRVPIFGALILSQGLIGWWMVKSGLDQETAEKYNKPKVSHYRLATHLGTAFALYSLLFWTGLSHLKPPQALPATSDLLKLKRMATASKFLIFVTAISGAFVAGLDAGLIYNTYPLMGKKFIPSDLLAQKPIWKNFLENPTTTQWDHRILGHLAFSTAMFGWYYAKKVNNPRLYRAACILVGALAIQITLGVFTLMSNVPKPLASAHQASALALLTSALYMSHETKLIRRLPK